MKKLITGVILAMISIIASASYTMAQDIAPFLGRFQGTGVSENDDSVFFAVTMRDLDITITAEENGGFTMDWITVSRSRGDPNAPTVKRKQTALTFQPTSKAGVFRATKPSDLLDGTPIWWSRVEGNSLFTYLIQLDAQGVWHVQKYTRTLSGAGMVLTFERFQDGVLIRQVKGRLIKVSG